MLVLARKLGERVRIADNITITVLRVTDKEIKLGFDAPAEIRIDRDEIARAREKNPDRERPAA